MTMTSMMMAAAADGDESPKSGGDVGLCQRQRQAGRRDDICVYGLRSGWQRRLSGIRGASSAVGGEATVLPLPYARPGRKGGGRRTPEVVEAVVEADAEAKWVAKATAPAWGLR